MSDAETVRDCEQNVAFPHRTYNVDSDENDSPHESIVKLNGMHLAGKEAMKGIISLVLSLGCVGMAGAASAQLLPADRTTAWAPGIPGGIPNRTTICTT